MIRRPPRPTLFPLRGALPIYRHARARRQRALEPQLEAEHRALGRELRAAGEAARAAGEAPDPHPATHVRSEEHTSELQSRQYLVCRLLLEKKNIFVYHLCLLF